MYEKWHKFSERDEKNIGKLVLTIFNHSDELKTLEEKVEAITDCCSGMFVHNLIETVTDNVWYGDIYELCEKIGVDVDWFDEIYSEM